MGIFHKEYRELNELEKQSIADIKTKAEALYDSFPKTPDGRGMNREVSLAITALEEAVMWAVKGITA